MNDKQQIKYNLSLDTITKLLDRTFELEADVAILTKEKKDLESRLAELKAEKPKTASG